MPSFNELIKSDPKYAAGKLKNALLFLVNNGVPHMYMNQEEFNTLFDLILAGEDSDVPTATESDSGTEDVPSTEP
ncbi:MAG: hypothetical protein NC489_25600 [Ruminococcus flavefaciens]|nr:hypothetical protein [Ruminococcus flavefaciens]